MVESVCLWRGDYVYFMKGEGCICGNQGGGVGLGSGGVSWGFCGGVFGVEVWMECSG